MQNSRFDRFDKDVAVSRAELKMDEILGKKLGPYNFQLEIRSLMNFSLKLLVSPFFLSPFTERFESNQRRNPSRLESIFFLPSSSSSIQWGIKLFQDSDNGKKMHKDPPSASVLCRKSFLDISNIENRDGLDAMARRRGSILFFQPDVFCSNPRH